MPISKIATIHVGAYIHGVPILWETFNRVCMQCSGSCLLYYTHDHYTCGCGTKNDIYIASLQCNNIRQEVGLGLGGIIILGNTRSRN